MCKNFREKGVCKYGDKCLFAHGDVELTRKGSPQTTTTKADEVKKDEDKIDESKSKAAAENTTLDTTKLDSSQNQTIDANVSKTTDEQNKGPANSSVVKDKEDTKESI